LIQDKAGSRTGAALKRGSRVYVMRGLPPEKGQIMLTRRTAILALAGGLAAAGSAAAGEPFAHDFAFKGIGGGMVRLADYAGQPVLVVNTASRCGFTGQYDGLQALWERYRDSGLVVLGVPSDDFNQELASEAEVEEFCEVNFAIDFPMTSITPVKGRSAHPFYAWAAREAGPGRAVRWNFHKYLVAPDGSLAGSFGTAVEPMSPEIRQAVERHLPRG